MLWRRFGMGLSRSERSGSKSFRGEKDLAVPPSVKRRLGRPSYATQARSDSPRDYCICVSCVWMCNSRSVQGFKKARATGIVWKRVWNEVQVVQDLYRSYRRTCRQSQRRNRKRERSINKELDDRTDFHYLVSS